MDPNPRKRKASPPLPGMPRTALQRWGLAGQYGAAAAAIEGTITSANVDSNIASATSTAGASAIASVTVTTARNSPMTRWVYYLHRYKYDMAVVVHETMNNVSTTVQQTLVNSWTIQFTLSVTSPPGKSYLGMLEVIYCRYRIYQVSQCDTSSYVGTMLVTQ